MFKGKGVGFGWEAREHFAGEEIDCIEDKVYT